MAISNCLFLPTSESRSVGTGGFSICDLFANLVAYTRNKPNTKCWQIL